jgi:hypothetical protein
MSLATMTHSTAKPGRRPRKLATLSIHIDGIAYGLKAYDFVADICPDEVTNLMEHSLIDPDGRQFQVYATASHKNYCERCDRHGCRHAQALVDVGLLD